MQLLVQRRRRILHAAQGIMFLPRDSIYQEEWFSLSLPACGDVSGQLFKPFTIKESRRMDLMWEISFWTVVSRFCKLKILKKPYSLKIQANSFWCHFHGDEWKTLER